MNKKYLLINHCLELTNNKILNLKEQIQLTQLAANNETKNTSGDKYETGKAMAHLEIDKLQSQLNENIKIKTQIELTLKNYHEYQNEVIVGSLVYIENTKILILASLGNVIFENEIYFIISRSAPIALELIGKKKGDIIHFQGDKKPITNIQ